MSEQKGFSLIEVLITCAIMGIAGLIFAGFMTNLLRQNRNLDSKSQLVDVVSEIRTELSSEAACLHSFGGQNPLTGFNVTQLRNRQGGASATQVPRQYGGINRNLFTLTGLRVQDFDDSITGVGDRVGSANLILTFDIGQNGVSNVINRNIRLHTEVNAAGAIIRCLALSGMTDGIWQKVSSNSQHIFYSSGNVGIGTQTPAGPLHVASGPIVQQSGDSLVNANAGTTRVGSGSRFVNLEYNHASGFAALSGSSPAGNAIGLPAGAVALGGSSFLLMNGNNTTRTQILQDGTGLRLSNNAGHLLLETPGQVSIEPQGGPLFVGSSTRPASAHVISQQPNILTLQRLGAGNLNSTVQFLNGSAKTFYIGMAGDETFGVGPNANLGTSDTWFEVNRSKGAQIRSVDPSVLTLSRTNTAMNTAIRFRNGIYNLYMGMTMGGDFAVDTNENLTSSPLFKYDRGGNRLEIAGSARATKFIESSDRRLKEDIQPLQNSLQNILKLQGVSFNWKNPLSGSKHDMGLIAQEVAEVYPHSVLKDSQGLLSVRYTSLIAPLIESVRELAEINKKQDRRIQELEKEILALKKASSRPR